MYVSFPYEAQDLWTKGKEEIKKLLASAYD